METLVLVMETVIRIFPSPECVYELITSRREGKRTRILVLEACLKGGFQPRQRHLCVAARRDGDSSVGLSQAE